MYLFIYKTTHTNGRFYIGRHQTRDLNDSYLGSGKWVSRVKDKTSLTREIIAEATSFEELCRLEEHHISLHFDNPLCMNLKRASVGMSSEDSSDIQRNRVENGTHPLLGGEIARKRVADGTHHFLSGDIQRESSRRRLADGTHPSQVKWTCPHCGKFGKGKGNYTRFHGDNCSQ